MEPSCSHDNNDNNREISTEDPVAVENDGNNREIPIEEPVAVENDSNNRKISIDGHVSVENDDNNGEISINEPVAVENDDNNREVPIAEPVAVENVGNNREIPINDPVAVENCGNNRENPINEPVAVENDDNNTEIPINEPVTVENDGNNREVPIDGPVAVENDGNNREIPIEEPVAVESDSNNREISIDGPVSVENDDNNREIPINKPVAVENDGNNSEIPINEPVFVENDSNNREIPIYEPVDVENDGNIREIFINEPVAVENDDNNREIPFDEPVAVVNYPNIDINDDNQIPEDFDNDDQALDFNNDNLAPEDNEDLEEMEDLDEDNYRLLRRIIINRPYSRNEDLLDGRASNCSSSSSTLTNSPQLVAECSNDYDADDSNATIRRVVTDKDDSNVGFSKIVCSNPAASYCTLDVPLSASALCDENCKRSVPVGECTQLDDGLKNPAVCTEHESPSTSAVVKNEESENCNNQKDNLPESGLPSFEDDDTESDDEFHRTFLCSCIFPKTDLSDDEGGNAEDNNENDDDSQNNHENNGAESAAKKRRLENGDSEVPAKRLCVAGPSRSVEGGLIDITYLAGPSQAVHVDITCVAGPYRAIENNELDIIHGPPQATQEGNMELSNVVASTFGIEADKENHPLEISSFVVKSSHCLQRNNRNYTSVDWSCVAGPSQSDDAVMVHDGEEPFEISIYIGTSSDGDEFSINYDNIAILNARLVNSQADFPNWLLSFLSLSTNDIEEALRGLLNYCSSAQLSRIMMTIRPVFERDFISLLPKEVALILLTYLEPKDLMMAAQTCRNWRTLSNDNILWKEKCRRFGIYELKKTPKYLITDSPWKSTYMKHFLIDKNWIKKSVDRPVVMNGHENHVITCLEFKGNFVLTGSDDCTLKVWSACSGRMLHDMVGHTGGVWSAQMVGDTIVSGSTDRTLRVWNRKTGKCQHILLGHTSTVRCLQMHEDKVVSGSRDSTLRIWSLEDGSCLQVLKGHSSAVRCVQYDGKYVVSGGYDFNVKVWCSQTGNCIHTLTGHTNRIYSLLFDGVHVVSGSLDTSIKVWDVRTGVLNHTLVGHLSLTSGMQLKGNILISGNADSTIKLWNIDNGRCLHTLGGPDQHESAVTCLQTTNRFIISSSDDGTVKLWDIRTGEFIRNLVELESGGAGGVVWRIRATSTRLVCAVGSRNLIQDTQVHSIDFNIPGTCSYCNE